MLVVVCGKVGPSRWLIRIGTGRPLRARQRRAICRPPGFTGRAPGGPSRWSTERTGEWEPLAPTLVVEIEYDHFTGGRFRHGTKLLRFRPDKSPKQCTMDQIAKKGRASPLKRPETG